jgi:hypothetical protein
MINYYARDGAPIDRDRYAELSEDDVYRQVAAERVGEALVSTVWLGLDHSGCGDPPLIFETMVFGVGIDDCTRYDTEQHALDGHRRIVEALAGHTPVRVTRNPEDRIIDRIDQLVNEQLAPGPLDDYNADRYVKCTRCGSDWHGLPESGCPGSDVEGPVKPAVYVDQVESVRYTLSDLMALRDGFVYREYFAPAGEVEWIGELRQDPRVSIIVGGREPAWLHDLIAATIRCIYDQLAAIGGFNILWLEGLESDEQSPS